MGQNNLVGLERTKLNCPGAASTDERTIDAMIAACSDAIQKYCRRDFHLRSYDELYSGSGGRRLLLREYPLVSVESVRSRPVTVLKLTNADTATNQQARVSVTRDGLQLWRMASGVASVDTSVTWASYPTLSAVANAVNALGGGWSAQVVGDGNDYGKWPSQDLFVPPSHGTGQASQGALTARGTFAELRLHTSELQGYQWDARGWLLRAIPYTDPDLLLPEDLVWPVGVNNFRVQYTAGYAEVPEAVQQACASWVAELWYATQRDPSLSRLAATGAGTQAWQPPDPANPPPRVAALLAPYRRHTVSTNQG
jgi:hypothetical protein